MGLGLGVGIDVAVTVGVEVGIDVAVAVAVKSGVAVTVGGGVRVAVAAGNRVVVGAATVRTDPDDSCRYPAQATIETTPRSRTRFAIDRVGSFSWLSCLNRFSPDGLPLYIEEQC